MRKEEKIAAKKYRDSRLQKKVLRERSENLKSLLNRSLDMEGRSESSSKCLHKAEKELRF